MGWICPWRGKRYYIVPCNRGNLLRLMQVKETANGITNNILRVVNMQPGCVADRINNVGVWDEAKKVYRKGNTRKGIFDISACIKGRCVWFEVKAGNDKPSRDQLIFQDEIRRAGGIAEFIHSTDEFITLFKKIQDGKF